MPDRPGGSVKQHKSLIILAKIHPHPVAQNQDSASHAGLFRIAIGIPNFSHSLIEKSRQLQLQRI
jgi:hypothetical protein